MAVQRDSITVVPPDGETVVVDILEDDVSLGTVHADRSKTRMLTLPLTITGRTSFYVPVGSGPYDVSVKLGDDEIAGTDGTPVTVSSFPAEIHARIDAAELGSVAGASGGSSAVPWLSVIAYGDTDSVGIDGYVPLVGSAFADAPNATAALVSDLSEPALGAGAAVVQNAAAQGLVIKGLGFTDTMEADFSNQLLQVRVWNAVGSEYLALASPVGLAAMTASSDTLIPDLATFTVRSQVGTDLSVSSGKIVTAAGGVFYIGVYVNPAVTP